MKYIVLAFGFWIIFAPAASGQISEIRVGIGEFSEDIINPGTEIDNGVEQSLALQGEIIFNRPEILKWALKPYTYVNGTLNLQGDTNHVGTGLLWRQNFGKKLYADFAFGGVIHDGTINIDPADFLEGATSTEEIALAFAEIYNARNTQREFGSRLLFREQLSLGYRLNEYWAGEIFFEHLSNGLLIGRKPNPDNRFDSRDNDSVDTLGIRFSKRF